MTAFSSSADITMLGNSVHSFSNPRAGNDKASRNAYNSEVDRRSFELKQGFYKELF